VRRSIAAHRSDQCAVATGQLFEPLDWIVVGQQVRGAAAPPAADAHPHARVGLDVLDVLRTVSVLGHHPERVVDDAPTDRGAPRHTALAPNCFQHRDRQVPSDPVDDVLLRRADDAVLQVWLISHVGHVVTVQDPTLV
jgi:hypothetical protein